MATWAVDTSWIVALFDPLDEHHAAAWKEAQKPDSLAVNPVIIVEFLEVVRRKAGRAMSVQALEDLGKLPHLRLASAPKVGPLARAFEKGGISWQDASAICTALDEGAGLRTFDANQRKAFKAMA